MRYTVTILHIFSAALITMGSLVGGANAAVLINFEGETSITEVTPSAPFQSNGFTFTPANDNSAVIDTSIEQMSGNSTDFLAFEEGNTMTITAPASFSLFSLDVGITSIASGSATNFTITGFRSGLPNLISSLSAVATTQTLNLNWTGLDSVTINVTDDAGIDNVSVEAVPEPTSTLLLALPLLGLGRRKRA